MSYAPYGAKLTGYPYTRAFTRAGRLAGHGKVYTNVVVQSCRREIPRTPLYGESIPAECSANRTSSIPGSASGSPAAKPDFLASRARQKSMENLTMMPPVK